MIDQRQQLDDMMPKLLAEWPAAAVRGINQLVTNWLGNKLVVLELCEPSVNDLPLTSNVLAANISTAEPRSLQVSAADSSILLISPPPPPGRSWPSRA